MALRTVPKTAPKVKILIADDHVVVREGIRLILQAQPDFEVIGEATDGEEAVWLARKLRPDVVVMDISMPKLSGLEATRQIREALPRTQVLILTIHDEQPYVFQCLRAGASGYVLKRAASTDLIEGVRAVTRGEAFLYPAAARGVVQDFLERLRAGDRGDHDELTSREREILVLIADGLNNPEIADRLFISVKTVQTHRAHIMKKLGLHDRSLLVRYAVRKGLIAP